VFLVGKPCLPEKNKNNSAERLNMLSDEDLEELRKLLDAAESKIRQVKSKIFSEEVSKRATFLPDDEEDDDSVKGVFDGEKMVASDKKVYQVPANYASKSKLVPGDVLKLTIAADGKFIYKQIGPVERKQIVGTLEDAAEGEFQVDVDGKKFRILLASVTYFKAKVGDKLSVVIPQEHESEWAAVDNVIL